MSRIAIVTPHVTSGDAVCNDVFGMYRTLRSRGFTTRIYAADWNVAANDLDLYPIASIGSFIKSSDDILIYHHSMGWESGWEICTKLTGRKVIKYHNVTPPEFFSGWSDEYQAVCRAGRVQTMEIARAKCDLYLSASAYNMAELIEAGAAESANRVVPPFHQTDRLEETEPVFEIIDQYRDGKASLLMVGSLFPNKGHLALLEAFAVYYHNYNAASRLFIVGKEGASLQEYSKHLRATAEQLGVADAVVFTGHVGEAALKSYYLMSDLFVTTSEHEGFCVPIIESMSMGIPVLALGSSAIPETIGNSGLVWDNYDPVLFAESIDSVVSDEKCEQQHGPSRAPAVYRVVYKRSPRATIHERDGERAVSKVAIVVQRCHESIVGGSESLAWQYANLLKDDYQTEVLTTTALATSDWANSLPAGEESRDGVIIRRFPVSIGRTKYWGSLHHRLLEDFKHSGSSAALNGSLRLRWPLPLQEEFVRTQGPYAKALLNFLKEQWADYQTIIFVTYLYATSYFGLLQVPRNFSLFVPTLHDEEPAYLSLYKHAAHRARSIIWLTQAEQRLGHQLWGELPGDVVGMNIDGERRRPSSSKSPYILYCGRIDPNKGCLELFDYFVRFKAQCPSDLRLVLAGKDDIPVPAHPDIDFRGFVSADEKFSLMAGATALAMPSARESFSIVTLEAMAQGAPVLASDKSSVIAEHVITSEGGYVYSDYQDFADKLTKLTSDQEAARAFGARGAEYVAARYKLSRVKEDLIRVVEACGRKPTPS